MMWLWHNATQCHVYTHSKCQAHDHEKCQCPAYVPNPFNNDICNTCMHGTEWHYVTTSCNTTPILLWDSFPSPPLVQPCTITFPTFRSHPYFLLWLPFHISFSSIASHYLTCYSLPSHQWCLFVPSYSSPSFPNPRLNPSDVPYMFTIPSGLGKSFVLFSYRLQTI